MFSRKRILYLGSISILLLSGLMFVAHTRLSTTAHASGCNTIAQGSWSYNCTTSETANSNTNFVYAIQVSGDGSPTNYNCSSVPESGQFGSGTKALVQCFQKGAGFPASEQDGIVGPMTWGAMYNQLHKGYTQGGWSYFYTPNSIVDAFRRYDSSGIWYVKVVTASTSKWCQMNTNKAC